MKRYWIFAAVLLLTGCSENADSSAPAKTEETLPTVILSGAADTTTSATEAATGTHSTSIVVTTVQEQTLPTQTAAATERVPIRTEPDKLPNTQTGIFESCDLQITFRGVILTTGIDLNTLLPELGTPDVQEDAAVSFGDVTISTTFADGADVITEIRVCSGAATAHRGGTVGMKQEEITAIYGTEYTTGDGAIRYTAPGGSLWFQLENGVVTAFGLIDGSKTAAS